MQVAVTNHAVERYQQRVPSSAKLDREAVRTMIRMEVERAFASGEVKDHPGYPDRRMISFTVGKEQLFLALGPNTTDYPGEWAVIGVLFDREVGTRSTGATLGDIIPDEVKQRLADVATAVPTNHKSKYMVRIVGKPQTMGEVYLAKDDKELEDLIHRRMPRPEDVEIYERKDVSIRQVYVIEKPGK